MAAKHLFVFRGNQPFKMSATPGSCVMEPPFLYVHMELLSSLLHVPPQGMSRITSMSKELWVLSRQIVDGSPPKSD